MLGKNNSAASYLHQKRFLGGELDNSWSILRDDCEVIEREVTRFQQFGKITILEIGSGVSTLVFAQLARKIFLSSRLESLEHDLDFFAKTQSHLRKIQNSDSSRHQVNLIHWEESPELKIETVMGSGEISQLFDLVFIDAPPDTSGELARLHVARLALSFLNRKGILILHDTNRIDERYAARVMSEYFHEFEHFPTQKGISVFRFPING